MTDSEFLPQVAASGILIDCNPAAAGHLPARRGRPPKASPIDLTRMIAPDGTPVDVFTKRRDYFKSVAESTEGDEWMIVFMSLLRRLVDLRICGDARLVIDWLCWKTKRGNVVYNVVQSDIAEDCSMSRASANRALGLLEGHDIVLRGKRGGGTIYLNPRYLFHGTPAAQRTAIAEWDRLQVERKEKLSPLEVQ